MPNCREGPALHGDLSRHHLAVQVGRALSLTGLLVFAISGCTTGDGEGPRYVGRVVSVTPNQVCVGSSSSSRTTTCGSVPWGTSNLPTVGQRVALFPSKITSGRVVSWSPDSLAAHVDDSRCGA